MGVVAIFTPIPPKSALTESNGCSFCHETERLGAKGISASLVTGSALSHDRKNTIRFYFSVRLEACLVSQSLSFKVRIARARVADGGDGFQDMEGSCEYIE
jgi:hypothetical protein